MTKVMGYQGVLLYGVKGSAATNRVLKRVDCEYGVQPQVGSTTSAGDGFSVPITTGEATQLTASMSFTMIRESNDAALLALEAASRTGNPIALAFSAFNGGLGIDADCVIQLTSGAPLAGEATVNIEVVALSASLREPKLNGAVTPPTTTTTTTTTT
jgi:hypothetical protein